MKNEKPAPGGDRGAGYGSDLNSAKHSLKISCNQAREIARALEGEVRGC